MSYVMGIKVGSKCASCGKGRMIRHNIRGTKFSFKMWREVPLEIDLFVPFCDRCEETVVSGADLQLIDIALAKTVKEKYESTNNSGNPSKPL